MVSTCHSKLWQYHCKGGKVPGVFATPISGAGTRIKPPSSPVILRLPRHVCSQSPSMIKWSLQRHKDLLWWSSSWSPLRNESLVKNYLWAILNCHSRNQALHSANVPTSQSQVDILREIHTENTNTGKTSWWAIQKPEVEQIGNAAASYLTLLSFALCFPYVIVWN